MKGFPSREQVEQLRQQYPKGTKICCDYMSDDPRPIPPGTVTPSATQGFYSVKCIDMNPDPAITDLARCISKLKLYFKWGIKFSKPFMLEDKAARSVTYMERDELMREVALKYPPPKKTIPIPVDNSFEPQEIPEEHKKTNIKTEKRS